MLVVVTVNQKRNIPIRVENKTELSVELAKRVKDLKGEVTFAGISILPETEES